MTLSVGFKYSHSKNFLKNCIKCEQKDETQECNFCGKRFYKKASMTLRVNSHNCNNNFEDEKVDKEIQNKCNICFKKFTAKKNLLKHLRDVHKNYSEAERMVVKKIKCPEKNCKFLCRMMKELRDHIEKSHEIKILRDILQFPSETVFQKWKKEEESNTVSWFVTGRKKTTLMNGTKKQILYCHRTGHYSPKGFGKYRMRSVGSCKIGVTCPAAMEVIESPGGELTVIYYKTHLGHMQDVVYLKLSREERTHLAEKIKQGFSFDAILDDVKESQDFDTEKKKRIHLLSKKDLYSIMRTENCRNNFKKKFEDINEDGYKNKDGENLELENIQVEKVKENLHQSYALYPSHNVIALHEKERNFEQSPHLVTHEKYQRDLNIPQSSRDGVTSEIVILSPDVGYTSVAEIILLTAGDGNLAQQTVLSQTKVPFIDNHSARTAESETKLASDVITEEKNKNKYNLHLQLKEKLQKISQLLPQSEYLTPKQFDLVNAKLSGILDIFKVANTKASTRKQTLKKKFKKKDKNLRNSVKIHAELEYKPEGTLGQQMCDSPLIYAFYK